MCGVIKATPIHFIKSKKLKSCITGLTNHKGSISHNWLLCSWGWTYKHTHIPIHEQKQFQETRCTWLPGLKISQNLFYVILTGCYYSTRNKLRSITKIRQNLYTWQNIRKTWNTCRKLFSCTRISECSGNFVLIFNHNNAVGYTTIELTNLQFFEETGWLVST